MDYIDRFYAAYEAAFGPLMTVHLDSHPEEMLVGPPNPEGWVQWRLIRRPGRKLDFTDIERGCGHPLPSSFKEWMSRFDSLDLDCGVVRMTPAPANDPLGPLAKEVRNGSPGLGNDLGLIAFGSEAFGDIGAVCFDTQADINDADWPVVIHDHEWPRERKITPMFSSFRALLECVTELLGGNATTADDLRRLDPSMPQAAYDYWSQCLRGRGA